MKTRTLAFCAAAIAALAPSIAGAANVDFKGKTIRIVIPYEPGGTYDLYGQTFAHFIKKDIPGDPTIILQYMPGAGGAKAMNWTYSIMPRDGLYMVTPLDNLVVTTALPVIRADLGASLSQLEWTVNAYTLTFAVLLLTGATLGDRFGRRRVFIIGLAIFTAGPGARRPSPAAAGLLMVAASGNTAISPSPVVLTTVPRYRSPTSGIVGLAIWLIAVRPASAGPPLVAPT